MPNSPENDSWSPNFATEAYPTAVTAAPVARSGLILFVAFLVEFFVIAAAANQSVAHTIAHNLGGHTKDLSANMGLALLTFSWRFTPLKHDTAHVWTGELALIGVVFLGTAILLLPLVRGAVTFLRAFVGAWLVVIVATEGAWTVRGLIVSFSGHLAGAGNRGNQAIFGAEQTSGYVLVGGAELGLVVAIVVAIVAVSSRRSPVVTPPAVELASDGASYSDSAAGGGFVAYQPSDGAPMPPQAIEPPQPVPAYTPPPSYDAPSTQAYEPPAPVPAYTPPPSYDAPSTQAYEPPAPVPAYTPPPSYDAPATAYQPPAPEQETTAAHAHEAPEPSFTPPPSYDAPSTQMYQPSPPADDAPTTQTFEAPAAIDYPAAPVPPMERDTSGYNDTAHLPDPEAAPPEPDR